MSAVAGVALAVLGTITAVGVIGGAATPAGALSGSQFNPGMIISDAAFYNSSTLNAAAIQSFLNSKYNSNCAGDSPVCVRDYTANITAQPAESGLCSALSAQNNVTAAQIFATVAQACGVNPEVLLVTAQKESGLITTSSPNYTTTMGYGCPDSTGCASKYFGFFNQVYLAARQFKLYRQNPDNYGYVAGESTFILYNPNTSCGGTNVFIQNQATAGLYDYTPYQPNAAALANLNGTGDSCSAYGNRNFWVYYNTWFPSAVQNLNPQPYDRGGFVGIKSDGSLWYYANGGTLPYPVQPGAAIDGGLTGYSTFASGDVNGDGRADLVADTPAGSLWLFVNNGGSLPFGAPIKIGFSGWGIYNRFLLADVTGDGRDDLVVTTPDGHAYYYANSGNPALPIGTRYPLGTGWQNFTTITAGDVDSDGYADIIGTKADGSLWLLHNTRNAATPYGTWAPYGTTNFSAYNTIFADDTNADGYADLVARRPDGSLWLFLNTRSLAAPFGTPLEIGFSGWGVFNPLMSVTVPVPHRVEPTTIVARNPTGGTTGSPGSLYAFSAVPTPDPIVGHTVIGASGWQHYRTVLTADVNGDGLADLIAVDTTGAMYVYLNSGNPAHPYAARQLIGTGWTNFPVIMAADMNGDHRADIVATTTTGALMMYLNNGSATHPFSTGTQIGFSGWGAFTHLALADINGDGNTDLLATTADGTLRAYLGNGASTFPFKTYETIGSSGWGSVSAMLPVTHPTLSGVIAPSDLLAVMGDGSTRFYRNVGVPGKPFSGGYTPLPTNSWTGTQQLVSGNVIAGQGTAVLDITTTGQLWLYANAGTDVYASPTQIGYSGWDIFSELAVGDVTGDRLYDVVATTPVGAMRLYDNSGGIAPFSNGYNPIGMSGWQVYNRILVGDTNGDGRADLVATKPDGTLWLYPAGTDVTHPYSAPGIQIGSGNQVFTSIALGDVTGDGLADFVGIKADGTLWMSRNLHNPSNPFGAPVQIGTGFGAYNRIMLGDVNQDGFADLVATKPDGSAWYCQNSGNPAAPFPGCVPTTSVSWKSYDLIGI